jgi:sugar lactone lactonase YvrE
MSEQPAHGSTPDVVLMAEPEKAIVGESPVWSERERVLYWVDITGQEIHRFDPATGVDQRYHLPDLVTAIGLRASGGLVVTTRKLFAYCDLAGATLHPIVTVEGDKPTNRFNDAKMDRRGRFWGDTMDNVHWDAPTGGLYRLDPCGRVTLLQSDVICGNGVAWSPDNRTMYLTESFRYGIFAYDFDLDSGAIRNRRLFATVDRASGGFPDGLTVDAEGCIWSVHNAIARVVRYTPAGVVDRVVEMPVPRPTSCAFGGDQLDVLYITSARETMTPDALARYPLSGSLFAYYPGVKGIAEPAFDG